MSGERVKQSRPVNKRALAERRIAEWTSGYAPLSGIPDEYIGADGAPRAHWARFLDSLALQDPDEINRRFGAADRHIHDMGISYRVYGETNERSWPLSHLPLLIADNEWKQIAAGVAQRATLLEHVL